MTNKDLFEALRAFEAEKNIPVDYMLEQIKKAMQIACKNYYDGNDNIVFTANPHKEENIAFLEAEGLPYDAINENADFIGRYGEGLNIYYNLLLDDKAGLKEAYDALDRLCDDYEEMLF